MWAPSLTCILKCHFILLFFFVTDENATEKIPTKRQHSAPEYLERRKQERRKSESTLRARLRRARKSDPLSPKEVGKMTHPLKVLCLVAPV